MKDELLINYKNRYINCLKQQEDIKEDLKNLKIEITNDGFDFKAFDEVIKIHLMEANKREKLRQQKDLNNVYAKAMQLEFVF